MSTRSLLNILLLIAIAVLGAVVYFQPGLKPDQVSQKLTALLPEQVDQIVIERQNQSNISLTRKQGGWSMTSPISVAANSYRIEPLLQLVQATSQSRFNKESLDLAKYQLEEPAVIVHFNDVDIAFGDSEPLNKRRYVLVGDAIHLISDIYYYRLLADLSGFVSTALLSENTRISRIDFPDFKIEYNEEGRWSVTPEHDGSTADTINLLLDEWRHAQAMQVSSYVPGQSSGAVIVAIEGSPELHFDILEREPEFILGRNDIGIQYHFTSEQGQRMMQWPSETDLVDDTVTEEKVAP